MGKQDSKKGGKGKEKSKRINKNKKRKINIMDNNISEVKLNRKTVLGNKKPKGALLYITNPNSLAQSKV